MYMYIVLLMLLEHIVQTKSIIICNVMTVFSLLGMGYVYMYFSMIDNMGGFKNVYDVKAVDQLYKTVKTNFRNEKLDM